MAVVKIANATYADVTEVKLQTPEGEPVLFNLASADVPFKYGGVNAVKVAEYSETFKLADTSFVIGSSASTSATTIKASVSNRFASPTIAIGDKDVVVVQTIKVTPVHSDSATNTAKQITSAIVNVGHISKRKTSDTSSKTTRQTHQMTNAIYKYYNTSSTVARANTSYGFYASSQYATFSSSTSANISIRVASPTLQYRANSQYESQANIRLVTDCTWDWHVDVYTVDSMSTLAAPINDLVDDLLVGN